MRHILHSLHRNINLTDFICDVRAMQTYCGNSSFGIAYLINMVNVLLKAFFTLQGLWNVECGGRMITNVDLSFLKQVVAHFKVLASFCFGNANSEFPITSFWIYIFTVVLPLHPYPNSNILLFLGVPIFDTSALFSIPNSFSQNIYIQ